jgi:hypothetical protein
MRIAWTPGGVLYTAARTPDSDHRCPAGDDSTLFSQSILGHLEAETHNPRAWAILLDIRGNSVSRPIEPGNGDAPGG